ncbi:MAG: tetratricopeptide repeat protein [Firmicutes bacterium]|nr:tetratricopeptide repeat protein [Eubacterium sp.]MBR2559868.1 tetratricopeptide repeat protein [Bacillota bacterium]MBR3054171.1 tetratricopeptide repeat protein [Bacillota bacterium]
MSEEIRDRIGAYLKPYTEEYLFDELSDAYLKKAGVFDIMKGVPVPIKKTDLAELSNLKIARAMAEIIGCDPGFRYRENYAGYIEKSFGEEFLKALVAQGVQQASEGDFERACISFRGALMLDPKNVDALYCYGRACKDAYEEVSKAAAEGMDVPADSEDYVGRFKAEALEAFEKLTLAAPDFPMGFYFLGYAYLNLGLYTKAKLTFDEFMEKDPALAANEDIGELRKEVAGWQEKLKEPVRIEEGYNHVLAGRYSDGLAILQPYENDDRFNKWWPLHFYLGICRLELGDPEAAAGSLREVLKLSPSNTDAMKLLAEIYEEAGDAENAEKYRRKIEIVERNSQEFRAEKYPTMS